MSAPPDDFFPQPAPGLDKAVRAHLDAEAERADGRAVWDAVLTKLNAGAQPPAVPAPTRRPNRRWLTAVGGLVATAAVVFLALFLWPTSRDVAASPADVVRAARGAHADGPDRLYAVSVEFPARLKERFPLLADDRRTTVRTRGDRFVEQPGFGGVGVWGRDADGVWLAPTREAAARFTADELPAPLREAVAVRGLELDTLLRDVLADYDLTWTRPPDTTTDADAVTAIPRGPVTGFHPLRAELTVEKGTHTVRTLVLVRRLPSDATVTVAFRLDSTTPRDDAAFTPAGHLQPGAPVHGNDRPLLRRRVLVTAIGEALLNGP